MHLYDTTELGPQGVLALGRRALELRAGAQAKRFDGARLAAMFLNPSLRTRASLEAACSALGVHATVLEPGKSSWALEFEDGAVMDQDKAEHVKDAARVLAQYADILAVRAFAGLADPDEDLADRVLHAFMQHAGAPIINLESALWHPMQGLADTATWQAHLGDQLAGKRLTLAWAPHPRALPAAVPNQVLLSAALQGMEVTVCHPEGFDLEPGITQRAADLASAAGGSVRISHDLAEGYSGAQVVVAKAWSGWSGYADRTGEATRRASLAHWRVDSDKMAMTDDAGFMHCLPVRRNVVVADEVLDGPNSWVMEEAGNRLWTAMAALEHLLGDAA